MSVSHDGLLAGRLRLMQPREGYRAGMDAALLAASCDAAAGARVLEAGCGVGAALLAAAARRPAARFTGIENDRRSLEIAHENISANNLTGRVDVMEGDVSNPFSQLGAKPFDAALANPPFFDDPSALRGPAPAKVKAWIARESLQQWIDFLISSVKERGSMTLIHRADRLSDILVGMLARAGSIQVRPIHPFTDAPAKRIVVRAIKGGKAPLKLLPPLILHARDGRKHTIEADAILRGEAALEWL